MKVYGKMFCQLNNRIVVKSAERTELNPLSLVFIPGKKINMVLP